MTKCDIHMRMIKPEDIPENMGNTGLATNIELQDADIADKMLLMHTLARVLKLDKVDILMFSAAELDNVFSEHETQIRMPGGFQYEG